MELHPITIPGGSDTEIQYNDGGIFGADSTHTFDDATKVETVQEVVVTQTATVKRLLAGGVTE